MNNPDRTPYVPMPDEIASGCDAIQRGWSVAERIKRAGGDPKAHWTVPVVTPEYGNLKDDGSLRTNVD